MDKEAVVYIHSGVLLSHKKECSSANCDKVDGNLKKKQKKQKWESGMDIYTLPNVK